MPTPIYCPRCDSQGSVQHVTIRALALDLWLCDECDATWRAPEAISSSSFEDYETLARSLGVSGLRGELKVHS